jgi:uncharacterized membrane protein YeaQ/YmgE (transglycosylase-associated protein family)
MRGASSKHIEAPGFELACACKAAMEALIMNFIVWLIVGGLAGWIAGLIVQGTGFGLIGDIVIGIVGAFIAGWLLPLAGFHVGTHFVSALVDAVIGAVIFLVVMGAVKRAV